MGRELYVLSPALHLLKSERKIKYIREKKYWNRTEQENEQQRERKPTAGTGTVKDHLYYSKGSHCTVVSIGSIRV